MEQSSIGGFHHPRTHVRVVLHGGDITFAATESELRKTGSKMCEWCDVEVRGILCSGKHRRALLEGLGLGVKLEEIGQYQDTGHAGLSGAEGVQEFGGEAELYEVGRKCARRWRIQHKDVGRD